MHERNALTGEYAGPVLQVERGVILAAFPTHSPERDRVNAAVGDPNNPLLNQGVERWINRGILREVRSVKCVWRPQQSDSFMASLVLKFRVCVRWCVQWLGLRLGTPKSWPHGWPHKDAYAQVGTLSAHVCAQGPRPVLHLAPAAFPCCWAPCCF